MMLTGVYKNIFYQGKSLPKIWQASHCEVTNSDNSFTKVMNKTSSATVVLLTVALWLQQNYIQHLTSGPI